MIKFQTMLLGSVIGRRSIAYTASSLWHCQKNCLGFFMVGIALLILPAFALAQVMGGETNAPTVLHNEVKSTAPDKPAAMTDIHDIQPPIAIGFDAPWMIPALIALAVVAILVVAWWFWKKYRKRSDIETIVPELPPEMAAMQALNTISDVRRLDAKTFYFRLSAIVRQYIFGRFGVGAPEMTTEEFVPCIDSLPVDRELAQQLRNMSRAMDPVKFGGETLEEKQMEADLFFAREFVRETTSALDTEGNDSNNEVSVEVAGKKPVNVEYRTSNIDH
jgi:hypothetical protein